jgi:hypothetical protein
MGGPLYWSAVHETCMSRSSCEAEIKAMDEGCSSNSSNTCSGNWASQMENIHPPLLYNDKKGGVCWALSKAITKKLRHLNIREVAVQVIIRNNDIVLGHIPGVLNLANIFTKKMKDNQHFLTLRSGLMSPESLYHLHLTMSNNLSLKMLLKRLLQSRGVSD